MVWFSDFQKACPIDISEGTSFHEWGSSLEMGDWIRWPDPAQRDFPHRMDETNQTRPVGRTGLHFYRTVRSNLTSFFHVILQALEWSDLIKLVINIIINFLQCSDEVQTWPSSSSCRNPLCRRNIVIISVSPSTVNTVNWMGGPDRTELVSNRLEIQPSGHKQIVAFYEPGRPMIK